MPMLAYSKAPAWMASNYYGFGFSTLEATRTSMQLRVRAGGAACVCVHAVQHACISPPRTRVVLQSLTASGVEVDAVRLTKPAGWAPDAAAAAALFAATPATPPPTPPVKLSHLGLELVLALVGQLTKQLKRSASELGSDAHLRANFGLGSAAYNLTNARPGEGGVVWSPRQVWEAAYPLVQAQAAARAQAPLLAGLGMDLAYVQELMRPGGRLYFGTSS